MFSGVRFTSRAGNSQATGVMETGRERKLGDQGERSLQGGKLGPWVNVQPGFLYLADVEVGGGGASFTG